MRSFPCTCRLCGTRFSSYSSASKICFSTACRAALEVMRRQIDDDDGIDPIRERDHHDCCRYDKCLDLAARNDSPHVCAIECKRYRKGFIVLEIPLRSNWTIESAPMTRRPIGGREADAEIDKRRAVARQIEPREGQQLELL
jgi:hypothetical protein